MGRACECDRVKKGHPFGDGQCLSCWLWYHRAENVGNPAPSIPLTEEVRPRAAPPARPSSGGPGTELKYILSRLGLTPGGCSCESRAKQMDAWKAEGCRIHRKEIVGWLKDEAGRRTWREKVTAATNAAVGTAGFRPSLADPFGSIVDEAIRRATPPEPRRVAELRTIAANPPPYPGGEGACVLTIGGGKYWPGVVVLARMLRDTGSTLPVQCWYRGSVEAVRPADVEGLGVELIDVESYPEWQAREPIGDPSKLVGNPAVDKDGWRVKLFAMQRTRFETVVYLDADAYPVADLEPFFALARAVGFAYWSDMSDGSAKWWPHVWPAGKGKTLPIQGGQLAIHRPTVWAELCVAARMNEQAAHYYRHVHGDQDTWRVAFAVTGREPLHLGKAPWDRFAFVCTLAGRPLIVHRVRCKMIRTRENALGYGEGRGPHYFLPAEARAFTHFAAAVPDEEPGAVFGNIYARKLWGEGSGGGSSEAEARPFVDWLNGFTLARGFRSVTDAGCGDGRVARMIQAEEYTGVDVVPSVVERNRREQPCRGWVVADLADVDTLPAADVLLSKDVLHHWPNARVREWLARVEAAGKWRAVVVCVDTAGATDGADCPLGEYRPLAPEFEPLKPFGFTVAHRFAHKSILVLDVPAAAPPAAPGK